MSGPRASLTDAQFERIARLVHDRCGFVLRAEQRPSLERHLAERMAAAGASRPADYLERIETDTGGEFRELVEGVLVQETFFFRTPAHFAALRDRVVPALRERPTFQKSGRPLSVWSAGCATGPEAYSTAITLLESEAADRFTLLASDISGRALEEARSGIYSGRVLRTVPPELLARYFVPDGQGSRVREEVRSRVQFRLHNLTGDPFPTDVDVLICRNVLIYFPPEVRSAVVRAAHRALSADGVIFVGPSETLSDFADLFERVWYDRTFAFRRRAPQSARPASRGEIRVPRRLTPVTLPSPVGSGHWRPLGRRGEAMPSPRTPDILVLALEGSVDDAHADRLQEALRRDLANLEPGRPTSVIFDLSRVSFLDAAGLRLLCRAARFVQEQGGRPCFVSATPSVRRWLDREGARANLEVHDSVPRAREALER